MQDKILIRAAKIIQDGGLVAFPTETVYGLGADAFNDKACQRIFEVKGRPSNNPLIVHVSTLKEAQELAHFNTEAIKLTTLWPGPVTMVLPKKKSPLVSIVTAGLDTVALRLPLHPIARRLIELSKQPIAAPSANKSGRLSSTYHNHVSDNFGDEIFVLKDENSSYKYGLESTIIDLSTNTPTILRFGFITPELIEQILGKKVEVATNLSVIKAPGMMHRHYAPRTSLRINAYDLKENEIGLNFGDSKLNTTSSINFNLSKSGNLAEAASNLFAQLHFLDNYAKVNGFTGIAVAMVPDHGIGLAINDRLRRGAQSQ